MERFVHNESVLHLRKQLSQTTDEVQRRQMSSVVAEKLKTSPISGDNYLRSKVLKRSTVLGGHRTSISLEDVFLSELVSIASKMGLRVLQLFGHVDAERKHSNLSSAICGLCFRTPAQAKS
jgi:predicted DNA-binding ribbon-helix-helix protein